MNGIRRTCFPWVLLATPLWASEEHPGQTATPTKQFRLVGYLPDYRVEKFDTPQAQWLTDVIYFSIQPKADGNLDARSVTPAALQKLRDIRRRYATRIHIGVGGWNRSHGFAAMATDSASRRALVANLLDYCRQHNFDGVDFDWEFPRGPRELSAYQKLLLETKQAFRPSSLTVTAALAAFQVMSPETYRALDRVHLMTYDQQEDQHATLQYATDAVQRLLDRGVPRHKIVLAVPFYGRQVSDREKTLSYADIVRRFRPSDEQDVAGGYSFNGIRTMRQKARFARTQHLAGIAAWELGQDTADATSLLRALHRAAAENDPRQAR